MIAVGTVLMLWVAALYRLRVILTEPRALWRSAYTVCMFGLALGATLFFYESWFESVSGGSGVVSLAMYLSFVIAGGRAVMFTETLARSEPRPIALLLLRLMTIFTVAALIGLWTFSLYPAGLTVRLSDGSPRSLGETFYLAIFYGYGVTMVTWTAVFFLGRGRAARVGSAGSVDQFAMLAIGAGSGLVAIAALLRVAARWNAVDRPELAGRLFSWFGVILPIALALVSTGVLSVALGPPLQRALAGWRRIRILRPLWADLTGTFPELRLKPPRSWNPLRALELREQRLVTEVYDVLRVTQVAAPVGAGPEALAVALRRSGQAHSPDAVRPALAVLAVRASADTGEFIEGQRTDREQLLVLARHYAMVRPGPAEGGPWAGKVFT